MPGSKLRAASTSISSRFRNDKRLALAYAFLLFAVVLTWQHRHSPSNSRSIVRQLITPMSLPKAIVPCQGRSEICRRLQDEKLEIGVEIGVQAGKFASYNMERWPSCKKYVLVDVWAHQVEGHYKDFANSNNTEQAAFYREAMDRLAPWKEKITVCRNFSTVCAPQFPDAYFDFVYVDARHDYQSVFEDLVAWWPKLKVGGIMAGHDYLFADELGSFPDGADWALNYDGTRNAGSVRGAVSDFFMSDDSVPTDHYRQVVSTYKEYASWMVRK